MATPPFVINVSSPGDAGFMTQHAPDERSFRDIVESWIKFEHGVSGHHRFLIGNTAFRNGDTGWVTGSAFWNTDHNALQLRSGTSWINPGLQGGYQVMFRNNPAPTGWTVQTDSFLDNAMCRSRNHTAAANGGTNGVSNWFVNGLSVNGSVGTHAVTVAEMPAHNHQFTLFQSTQLDNDPEIPVWDVAGFANGGSGPELTALTGNSEGHGHSWSGTVDMPLKFWDVVLCSRNAA